VFLVNLGKGGGGGGAGQTQGGGGVPRGATGGGGGGGRVIPNTFSWGRGKIFLGFFRKKGDFYQEKKKKGGAAGGSRGPGGNQSIFRFPYNRNEGWGGGKRGKPGAGLRGFFVFWGAVRFWGGPLEGGARCGENFFFSGNQRGGFFSRRRGRLGRGRGRFSS